ncbi:MAG: cupin domain-containing protein [Candidatus Zixiibacteriota bacterium]|nr:MAG: cupin domain-containing protein [candidate division Zixibacteria bacterium]
MQKINLKNKLNLFDDLWSPKIVGELNGQYVKLVKFQDEYVWHSHENEDELFLVIDGEMDLHFRDRTVKLNPGEFFIVPKKVEHKPAADEICSVLLFEPATTRNTGDVNHNYTIEPDDLERI